MSSAPMAEPSTRWAFARTTAFRVTLLHLMLTLAGTALVGGVAWWVTAGYAIRQAGEEIDRGMGVLLQSGARWGAPAGARSVAGPPPPPRSRPEI
jgi:hypothetical protein